jgi:hypothetical protein
MGTGKRGGVEPTHAWQLLLPLCCSKGLPGPFPAAVFYLQIMGDRRDSNPRPSEPQFDAARYRLSWCVRLFGLFIGFSAISKNAGVCCLLACTGWVAVRLQYVRWLRDLR